MIDVYNVRRFTRDNESKVLLGRTNVSVSTNRR